MMFGQSFPDFGLSDGVLFIVRIIATIGGAVIGWFAADPVTRVSYWAASRKPTPGSLLFTTKSMSAITLALLIYMFMPLGGGGGGLGWGPGLGGNPGKGPGQGGDKGNAGAKDVKPPVDAKDAKPTKDDKANAKPVTRLPIDIEILGGPKFKPDGKDRYYLIRKSDPSLKLSDAPLNHAEVEAVFKEYQTKLLIRIVHTDDSAVIDTESDPTRRLQKLASKYEIPTQGPKE
jgi:hypothetical protein